MKKTLKCLSPLILVIFFFTAAVGPGWGEEPFKIDIKYCEYNEDKSEIGKEIDTIYAAQTFAVALWAYNGGELIKDLKIKDREAALVGMKIAERYKKIDVGGRYVDKGIIEYCTEKKGVTVATIDKKLKRMLRDKATVITIQGRKNIKIE